MAKISDAQYNEQASTPSTPSSGYWKLYPKADGLHLLDDAGNEYGPFGTFIGYADIVDHGATAGTARPSHLATDGTAPVLWRGTVEPTNAVNGDDWLDYS